MFNQHIGTHIFFLEHTFLTVDHNFYNQLFKHLSGYCFVGICRLILKCKRKHKSLFLIGAKSISDGCVPSSAVVCGSLPQILEKQCSSKLVMGF